MSQERDEMIKALKKITIPELRKMGFSSSFPHFRRIGETQIDLITFQFDRYGGKFLLEISKCPPEGIITAWGEKIPANKVRAWDMNANQRERILPNEKGARLDWFRYDRGPFAFSSSIYDSVAESVIPSLQKADNWWNTDICDTDIAPGSPVMFTKNAWKTIKQFVQRMAYWRRGSVIRTVVPCLGLLLA